MKISVRDRNKEKRKVEGVHASDSCLMLDYVRIINFRIIIIIIIIKISVRDRNIKINHVFGWVLMNFGHYNLIDQMNIFLKKVITV